MNMQQMVQTMQKVQREYEKARLILDEKVFEFTANGVLKLTMRGNMEIVDIEILDEEILNKDDKDMLVDMFKLAYDNCREQIQKADDELTAKFQNPSPFGKMF